jgi:hypothetical protein
VTHNYIKLIYWVSIATTMSEEQEREFEEGAAGTKADRKKDLSKNMMKKEQ